MLWEKSLKKIWQDQWSFIRDLIMKSLKKVIGLQCINIDKILSIRTKTVYKYDNLMKSLKSVNPAPIFIAINSSRGPESIRITGFLLEFILYLLIRPDHWIRGKNNEKRTCLEGAISPWRSPKRGIGPYVPRIKEIHPLLTNRPFHPFHFFPIIFDFYN